MSGGFQVKYPRMGSVQDLRPMFAARPNKKRPPCCVCGKPADAKVFVEVYWFRGNDESASTCWEHRRDLQGIVASWKKP